MEEVFITELLLDILYGQFGEPDMESISEEMKEVWLKFFEKRANSVL